MQHIVHCFCSRNDGNSCKYLHAYSAKLRVLNSSTAATVGVPAEAMAFDKQSDTYPGLPASMASGPTLSTSKPEGTATAAGAAADGATVAGEDVVEERDSGAAAAATSEVSAWPGSLQKCVFSSAVEWYCLLVSQRCGCAIFQTNCYSFCIGAVTIAPRNNTIMPLL
jgi:hypothetical protein